ncbi:MAG TPA: serine/threonine-protein kinase, partial [Polyangium sp.]|nr:serine/threonine-protein kinase [Polyangium sp.]
MATLNLAEGTIFAGRYKVGRCIAAGGMGAVYEVVHVETDRHRALKVLLPHLVESDDMRERFRREARVAAQIQSAYIVDVFDAGIDETTQMPFLVMELLKGEELGKRLKRLGKFGFEATVGHLWQAALALDKTHRANIVHRDLKPENLFLCDEDDGPPKIKVLDFGIAKILVEGGTKANATRAMGTPLYMAPEQFRPKLKLSPATDIYALGLVAYTLLVGAPYWAEEQAAEANPYAFAATVMHGPSEPPTVRAARRGMKLPAAFDEWFAQATSTQPEKRFVKATVAIMSLASALGVPAPTSSAALAVDSKEPQDASAPAGQTPAGQTGSGSGGTVPMAVPTAGTGTEAMLGTNPGGYGLSASLPMVALEPPDTPNMGPQAQGS